MCCFVAGTGNRGADGGAGAKTNGERVSSSDESSDEENETRKAPNQLIMEFLQCMMANDVENGLKLCKMSKILLYSTAMQPGLVH